MLVKEIAGFGREFARADRVVSLSPLAALWKNPGSEFFWSGP
jgi:hypothetical protein